MSLKNNRQRNLMILLNDRSIRLYFFFAFIAHLFVKIIESEIKESMFLLCIKNKCLQVF